METEEIERLIAFHQAGLDQYRQYMSPSSQHLEERTIQALQKLAGTRKNDSKARTFLKKQKRSFFVEECTAENPCCDRRGEYNGFGSGTIKFTCPKDCPCHD